MSQTAANPATPPPEHTAPRPEVTVLIPVHNGATYLESALRSIMGQTLREIEILVVDDGSSDDSPAIMDRLAAEDPRLRIERLAENLRLPGALNHGLDIARAPYVARMDCDDLAEPDRLAVQKHFLDTHPGVRLVGSGVVDIDAAGRPIRRRPFPADAFAVSWRLRFNLPFAHPTYMFRAEGMEARYDPAASVSEDYDILARISLTEKVASVPEVLLKYRIHDGSITGTKWDLQQVEARAIATRVQQAQLSPEVFDALDGFRRAYYAQEKLDRPETSAMFAAFRRMLAEDLKVAPGHRTWMRRQIAQVLWGALWRMRLGKRRAAGVMLRHGADFMPALIVQKLENRGDLPNALKCAPEVWAADI